MHSSLRTNIQKLLLITQKRRLSSSVTKFESEITKQNKKYKSKFVFPSSYKRRGSVYIHWPYCRQRCSYCNFVKFIPRPGDAWTIENSSLEDAMVKEVKTQLQQSHIDYVSSVFFGGGTPSLARPQLVEKIICEIKKVCTLEDTAEVTLEGNPASLEMNKLKDFKDAGINRVSIGIQALDNKSLKILNRDHALEEALECLSLARILFPERVSIDLIFGRPEQTLSRWEKELNEAMNICDNHISLYQLTVERGTQLHREIKSGKYLLPDDETMADMYEMAISILESNGFHRYEVSNFARNNSSQSVHNRSYWEGSQYIGVGPGAHGRLVPKECHNAVHESYIKNRNTLVSDTPNKQIYNKDFYDKSICGYNYEENKEEGTKSCAKSNMPIPIREARINAADPLSWLMEVNKKGTGIRKNIQQSHLDVMSELVTSGLRMSEGISAERWNIFSPHKKPVDIFKPASWLEESNLLIISSDSIKATPNGLNVLDSLLPYLINCLNENY